MLHTMIETQSTLGYFSQSEQSPPDRSKANQAELEAKCTATAFMKLLTDLDSLWDHRAQPLIPHSFSFDSPASAATKLQHASTKP